MARIVPIPVKDGPGTLERRYGKLGMTIRARIKITGSRHSTTIKGGDSKAEKQAREWLRLMRKRKAIEEATPELKRSPRATKPKATFADMAEPLRRHWAATVKPNTASNYESQYASLLNEGWRDRQLMSVTDSMIQAAKAEYIQRGLGQHTRRHRINVLRAAIRLGVSLGYIPHMPCEIKLPTVKREPIKPIPEDELGLLVVHARGLSDPRPLIALLLGATSGLRIAEIASLKWGDVTLSPDKKNHYGSIYLKGKGDKVDTVPILDRELALLLERHAGPPADSVLGLSTSGVRQLITRKLTRPALGRPAQTHNLRRRVATRLLNDGVPAVYVQKRIMRHSDLATTLLYCTVSDTPPDGTPDSVAIASPLRTAGEGGS